MNAAVMTVCGYIACGFLGALALIILWFIWTDKIDLSHLLSEANHEASLSRFQLLIFTFVVAIGLFELIEKSSPPAFPDIPQGVLTLLGISATTYAVGKGISYSQPDTLKPNPTPESVARAEAAADRAQGHASAAEASAETAKGAAKVASVATGVSVAAAGVATAGAVEAAASADDSTSK
jgi:hypothetical protein